MSYINKRTRPPAPRVPTRNERAPKRFRLQNLATKGLFVVLILSGLQVCPTPAQADSNTQNSSQYVSAIIPDNSTSAYAPFYYDPENPTPVQATQAPGSGAPTSKSDWDANLGIGIAYSPKYPGSRYYHFSPLPLVSVSYQQTYFLSPLGLRIVAINADGFKAGPVIGFDGGRNHNDDSRLNQLGNIAPSLDAGGFVAYALGPIEFSSVVKQAVTHFNSYGLKGDLAAHYGWALIPSTLDLSAGPEIDFADGDYMRTWYGVTSSQAAASGLRGFTPSGGVEDVGVSANLVYHLSEHIKLHTFVKVSELVGDAANSPITESALQVRTGLGIAYHF